MKKIIALFVNITFLLSFLAVSVFQINVVASTKAYTQFSSCDTNWKHYELEATNYKEGSGAVGITLSSNQIRPLQSGNGADRFMQITSENIELLDATGGLGMWVWIDNNVTFDIGDIQLTSSETSDTNAYVWNISAWKNRLSSGWTWLTLKFSEAQKLGNPNPNALNFMRLYIVHKSSAPKRFLVDDIRLIDVTNQNNLAEPTYSTDPLPVDGTPVKTFTKFSSCDTNWTHFELNSANYKEGSGSVGITLEPNQIRPLQSGNGGDRFMQITSENINLSDATGGVGLWIWTENDVTFNYGDIQLTSSENSDTNAYVWNMGQWKDKLSPGWTWLTLTFSDAQKLGNPNPNELDFIRLFIVHTSSLSKKFLVDDIRLLDVTNDTNLNPPTYPITPPPVVDTPTKLYTNFNRCDTNWTHFELETKNVKESTGAVGISLKPNEIRPLQSGNGADKFTQITSENINLSDTTGGLGMWVWIDKDVAYNYGDIQLTSSETSDKDAYVWNISLWKDKLSSGWTWLTLRFSDAQKLGNPNPNALNFMRLFIAHNSKTSKRFLVDDIRLLDVTSQSNLKEPIYSVAPPNNKPTNLPNYYKLLNCDSDWGRYTFDAENKKEGKGSISQTILGNMSYFEAGLSVQDASDKQKPLTPLTVKFDLNSCYIGLWIYYDGLPFIKNGAGIIEVGSGGKYDTDSYQFPRQLWENQIDTKTASWNWVVLKFTDAVKLGNPKLSSINYFRLYFAKNNDEQCIINLDDIRIIDGDNENNLKAPNYLQENEKFEGTGDYYTLEEKLEEESLLKSINDLQLKYIKPYEGYALENTASLRLLSIVIGCLSIVIFIIATGILLFYIFNKTKNKDVNLGN